MKKVYIAVFDKVRLDIYCLSTVPTPTAAVEWILHMTLRSHAGREDSVYTVYQEWGGLWSYTKSKGTWEEKNN
jgi:hypothetical protein